MFWESGGFDSWDFYGVRSQPSVALVDAEGNPLGSWGGFPEDEVLEVLG